MSIKPNIGTKFKLSDNSGIKKLKNINILHKNKKVNINNNFISIVKKGRNVKENIKKSDLVCALIVRTKKHFFNYNKKLLFNSNSAVLLDKNSRILFTKMKGILPDIIKNKIYKLKINLKKAKFI